MHFVCRPLNLFFFFEYRPLNPVIQGPLLVRLLCLTWLYLAGIFTNAGIRLHSVSLFNNVHYVRLGNHTAINTFHGFAARLATLQVWRFHPRLSFTTLPWVHRSLGWRVKKWLRWSHGWNSQLCIWILTTCYCSSNGIPRCWDAVLANATGEC